MRRVNAEVFNENLFTGIPVGIPVDVLILYETVQTII